eukprot:m.328725 g.328725  ORF g.328725 m.328725 type:complete len:86 (-) comp20436_c1_seq8:263-520(-)
MQDFSAITSAKGSKLNAGEKLRMKEIREEIMKGFSLVQGAAQRIVALPESAQGRRKKVASSIRDAAMQWQQPLSVSLQSATLQAN